MGNISKNKKEKLEKFVTNTMNEFKIPGLSLSIVKNQESLYKKGFGSRDLKRNLPASAETLYGIGSCSKSFTSLAILQLVEKEKLALDDQITDYLPLQWSQKVTVHDLLTHSSGMPSLGVSTVLIDRLIDMDERGPPLGDLDDFYTHLNNAEEEIVGGTGENFFYFNSGYELLGLIIEEITGIDYSEYIQENILRPLNMTRSTFEYREEEEDIMTPYFMGEGGPEETSYPLRKIGRPAGGLISSANELSNYLIMNMNGGYFQDRKIIDKDLLEKAHNGYMESWVGNYGYGWYVNEFLDEILIGHSGSIAVASGYIGFIDNLGVALVSNTSPSFSLEEIGKAVMAIIKGEKAEELPFYGRKKRMDMLTGKYESYRGIREAEVEKNGGLLELKFKERSGNQKLMLIPETKNIEDFKFYFLDANGEKNTVEFDVGENGNIDLYVRRWRLHKI